MTMANSPYRIANVQTYWRILHTALANSPYIKNIIKGILIKKTKKENKQSLKRERFFFFYLNI